MDEPRISEASLRQELSLSPGHVLPILNAHRIAAKRTKTFAEPFFL
jgi:hypothetical protein